MTDDVKAMHTMTVISIALIFLSPSLSRHHHHHHQQLQQQQATVVALLMVVQMVAADANYCYHYC